jgi:flagellar hook assembly protein FlgD
MRVYNRWGEKVFETTDKNAEWDGVFNGNGVKNSNVYIWVVTFKGWDNKRYTEKGTVTFMR